MARLSRAQHAQADGLVRKLEVYQVRKGEPLLSAEGGVGARREGAGAGGWLVGRVVGSRRRVVGSRRRSCPPMAKEPSLAMAWPSSSTRTSPGS